MATTTKGGDMKMKGFYRQKKGSGVSKSKKISASHGSLHLKDDFDKQEEILRQFDMNMAYGPCIGMNRLNRWERANKLGLNPPKEVERLVNAGGKVGVECLWDGRV
ncbi:hypothetical protein GIB67_020370 [Kingdonia uniflora]|uniref:DNA polymerase delta subunit 4 n=1 Tax=Kingdonia uniflora TaxID=39325 RepID=A0A7J7P0K5_9MAGN|nr:hypothetical protein GIB67_038397 [Kingdonia uniflora]KAF6172708.1 hypothetical protein GIB67_020370 [Kingdonia uniflora]